MKRILAVMILMQLLLAVGSRAETLLLGVAPVNPKQAGFRLWVSMPRLGGDGFQPVHLKFQALGKQFNRQRRLRLQFRPRAQYATPLDFQYSCDVTVPEGQRAYETSILVPQFYRWERLSLRISEDGRLLGDVPSTFNPPQTTKNWGQHISVGVLTCPPTDSNQPWARFPDLRSLVTVLGDGPLDDRPQIKRFTNKQARDYVDQLKHSWVRFRIIDEDEMQRSWLGYSQLDLLLAPFPILDRMSREQPERLDALLKWASTGGQIWAYSAPADLGTAAVPWLTTPPDSAVNQIQFYPDPAKQLSLDRNNDTSSIDYQPWGFGTYYTNSYTVNATVRKRQTLYDDLTAVNHPMVKRVNRPALLAQMQIVPHGLGRVVLLSASDPFPGSFQLWQALDAKPLKWKQRQGIDYRKGNDSYWAWLMPAVGQPPVTMFVILNGLFVLLIGPVLYFVLRRRKRLYLLYFLAPALAFLVTTGLFCYAYISDGFDNRARIRQLTWVDARGKDTSDPCPQIDQSRQTYYTVIDNQQGLHFDDQSLVLPVHHSERLRRNRYYSADDSRSGEYRIEQTSQSRRYSGAFLPTRDQVHYLVTRPSIGEVPVEVDFKAYPVRLTNRLSTPIRQAAIRAADGSYWTASNLPPGATTEMTSTPANVFGAMATGFIDPAETGMPAPYLSRASTDDRSYLEDRMRRFSQSPPQRSFLLSTEVDQDVFALRRCLQDQCVRLIGGRLP
ncbi:hypothetical protein FYK55_15605 [Roseiconus nitratireducens]|uniref:Uncharacterized protein n=1 Tax=Roseiconus nitratireducens TaxID=2605748 RepID=A0A5M6D3Y5_9BACT|nr:hypothetical protein [Roseiconus nitratireducens]KAA5542227.1 hypothetical protein FYK55_15605 [Roseiconus nitratireducens]